MSESAWQRIDSWLRLHAPPFAADLRGAASDDDFRAAEAGLGVALDPSFKAAYRVHDGQSGASAGIAGDWGLLSLAAATAHWQRMDRLQAHGRFAHAIAKPDTGVRPVWWSPSWIPFAHDGAGNLLCIDYDPADGGKPGQVVSYVHDAGGRARVADSLGAWLAALALALEEKRLVLVKDALVWRTR